MSVAVGVGGLGHGCVGRLVGQQGGDPLDDALLVGSDQLGDPEGDGLGTLGVVPHDQDGLGQRGGLLLDAAGVGEHDVAAVDECAEGAVLQRVAPDDVGVALDLGQEVLANLGVAVDRQHEEHLGMPVGQARDGAADGPHRLAPGLTAVGGDEHDSPGGVLQCCGQLLVRWRDPAVDGDQERVDDRVARDADGLRIGVLAQQVVPAGGGGAQVQGGHLADEPPVGLLGEG